MHTFTDDEYRRSVQDDTGIKPEWAAEAFTDLDEDVRQSIARMREDADPSRRDHLETCELEQQPKENAAAMAAAQTGGQC